MGVAGIGEAPTGHPGLLDGLLHVHAELHHVEEELGHGLALHVAAGGAKGHPQFAVAEGHRGIRRQAGPLAGEQAGRMLRVQPSLVAAGGHGKAQAGHQSRAAEAVAGRGREAVAPAVNHADVAGVGFRHRGHRLRVGRLEPLPVLAVVALVVPGVAGVGHVGAGPGRVNLLATMGGIVRVQQPLHRHVHKVGVTVVGMAVGKGQL